MLHLLFLILTALIMRLLELSNYTNLPMVKQRSGINGDVILFDIYYHNNGTDTATNTITRIDFPIQLHLPLSLPVASPPTMRQR
jgi:hypothetical protein